MLPAATLASGSRTGGYDPLGWVQIDGTRELVVDRDRKVAYVATDDGFAAVDVSEPRTPEVVAAPQNLVPEGESDPLELIQDLSLDGDRLLVPGPAIGFGSLSQRGFFIFDVSDPADPERLMFYEANGRIHNALLRGERAYLAGGHDLEIVDVSGSNPRQLGSLSVADLDGRWREVPRTLRNVHDLWVNDGIAFLAFWDAGTWIVDVTDPIDPEPLAQIPGVHPDELQELTEDEAREAKAEPPGNHHNVRTTADGSTLAIGKESTELEPGNRPYAPSGVELWDVSDAENPSRYSTIHPPPVWDPPGNPGWSATAHNLDLREGRLVSAWNQGGVRLFDVANPSAPEEIASWRDPRFAMFFAARFVDDETFVASANPPGGVRGKEDLRPGLYVFPNRPGEQQDAPVLTKTPRTATPRRTPTPTSTLTPTETFSPTPTPTASPSPTATTPGFGFAAGLGAVLGMVLMRLWRRR